MRIFKKTAKFLLIFVLLTAWLFSGFPRIWQNPPFPPKIQEARAAVSYVGGVVNSRTGHATQALTFDLTALTGGSNTSPSAGDIVIVTLAIGAVADKAMSVTTDGYTANELTELYANDNYDTNLAVYWKIMGSTPDGTVTTMASGDTAAGIAVSVQVWRGVDQSNPIDVAIQTATGIDTGRPTPPAITPTTTGAVIIAMGASAATVGAVFTTATLSNFITRTQVETQDISVGMGSYAWSSGTYTPAQFGGGTTGTADSWAAATLALRPVVAPTVSTQAADPIGDTTATCNGTIEVTGGVNSTAVGCEWDIDSGAPYANNPSTAGDYGAVPFTQSLTGLPTGTTIYARAFATNSAGTGYGGEVSFLTKPAAPTGVAATDTLSDKVTITWTKSTGATDYHVWRGAVDLGSAGDVDTLDDTGADAPTVTAGTASATDGSANDKVTLSITGESANNGTSYDYKVVASNATGNSADSATDPGYRAPGALTFQWYRSSGTGDSDFSSLSGATTDPYDDTTAPAPTITAGTADASDGTYVPHVALSLSGQSTTVGESRYYYATVSATGASSQDTTHNDGYRGVGSLTFQWQRSAADSDADYSNIDGATTASYDDTGAPADGSGRWYRCVLNATGATEQTSTADRGYRSTYSPSLTFSISDTTIGFGTLVLNKARFATANEAGADGPTATSAHNLTITTNAPSGYTITYKGATLTATGGTISPATITNDQDGTPGTEQFAIGFSTNGNATIASAYNQVSPNFKYSFVASTTTSIISETGATTEETIAAYYLANISSITEAGDYSTSITYIATGNF